MKEDKVQVAGEKIIFGEKKKVIFVENDVTVVRTRKQRSRGVNRTGERKEKKNVIRYE